MLFLGLGTGLGSAMIIDGVIEPMEIGHLPYKKGKTFEDLLGVAGLENAGKKKMARRGPRGRETSQSGAAAGLRGAGRR